MAAFIDRICTACRKRYGYSQNRNDPTAVQPCPYCGAPQTDDPEDQKRIADLEAELLKQMMDRP